MTFLRLSSREVAEKKADFSLLPRAVSTEPG